MIKINGINTRRSFSVGDHRVALSVRFNPAAQLWQMDVELDGAPFTTGLPIACGIPLMKRAGLGFYFWCDDTSGQGLDPFTEHCFESRCQLHCYLEDVHG